MPVDSRKGVPDRREMVNHPAHYNFSRFEVIEVLEEWFPEEPLVWQVVKYLARAKHKGRYLQDLEKAKFYLDRQIEKIRTTSADADEAGHDVPEVVKTGPRSWSPSLKGG